MTGQCIDEAIAWVGAALASDLHSVTQVELDAYSTLVEWRKAVAEKERLVMDKLQGDLMPGAI